jgi:microcin C transport system substrate-binding protein
MRRPLTLSMSFLAAGLLALGACGEGGAKPAPAAAAGGSAKGAAAATDGAPTTKADPDDALIEKYKSVLDIPMVTYAWDKNAGDKSVSAELGGPGFTGEGWTTNLTFPALGWPGAPKGGTIRQYLLDWPATLRLHGENWNEAFNYAVNDLCAETLLVPHPNTLEYTPSLATHWKISPDRQTYTFRLNPEARFSDGSEVTADDVVASFKLRMDPTCRDPSSPLTFGKMETPVVKSKYVVEVHCKEDNWRNFLYFTGMAIFPAKEISIPGDKYLDKYQNSYTALSGAYMVRPEDIKMGQSIALTRRKDWWGAKNPANAGVANVDRFEFEVVKDINLAYEKVKKGEIDLYVVPKAQWWVQEIPQFESVKRGLLQMHKIYNDQPIGTSGIAINMKKAPLDDIRIRKALQFLSNRRLWIQKLFYNEYEPLTFYEGGVYANPDNKEMPYDPVGAVDLLEQAGWKDVNQELYRVKDGKVLELEVLYDNPLSERYLTPFQEDCKKAGIKLNLKQLTPASRWKSLQGKEYELCDTAWGALVFPNPETSWKGELADSTSNNNVTGFKNKRVDELCTEYDRAYDVKRRIEIVREIDGLVYKECPYVLGWYLPSIRFLAWDKIGIPPWGCGRTVDNTSYWYNFWVDPKKDEALAAARQDASKTLPVDERDNRFWPAWNARQRRAQAGK